MWRAQAELEGLILPEGWNPVAVHSVHGPQSYSRQDICTRLPNTAGGLQHGRLANSSTATLSNIYSGVKKNTYSNYTDVTSA